MINIYKISKENSNYKDRMETKTVSKLMLLALLGTDIFFLWWLLICEVSENRKGCLERIAQEILIGTCACACACARAHTCTFSPALCGSDLPWRKLLSLY